MKRKAYKSHIFWRIFSVLFITIVLLLSFVYIASSLILPRISQQQFKEMTDLASNRLAEQANLLVENAMAIADGSQQNDELLSKDINQLDRELNKLVDTSPFFDGGAITDEQGDVLVSRYLSLEEYGETNYLPYLMQIREGNNAYFSNVLTRKSGKANSVILFSMPIESEKGVLKRVVHLSIHLDNQGLFQSIFKDLNLGMDSYAYIVDSTGKLIAHPQKEMLAEDVSDNPAVMELLNKNSGYMSLVNEFEVEMYSSYEFIPGLEWGVVAQVPSETTLLGTKEFQKVLWVLSLIVLFLLTLISAIHAMATIKPLRKLYKAVDQIAKGNFQTSIEGMNGKDEIGLLSQRFNEMISSLQSTRKLLASNEKSLKTQKEFLRKIIDKSPNSIYIMDYEGKYTLANEAYTDLLGSTPKQIIGKTESDFNSNAKEVELYMNINREVMENKEERFIPEAALIDSQGNKHWMQVVKIPIIEDDGICQSVLCFATNITERILNEEKIKFHASHDSLTKLPNRYKFKKCLDQEIELASEDQSQIAVLFMDLDRFKYINDNFGHNMGDKLLKAVSDRLKENLDERDTISRLGGDEFTVILSGIDDKQQVSSIASKLIHALAQPYQIEDQSFVTTTSIGVSMYPADGEDVESLIKYADTAMYQAKNQGKNTYRFYQHEMNSILSNKFKIETYMRDALKKGEFALHYQPKMDTKTGKLSGMEALLRWEQEELGMVSPAEFIPIAEESGMIIEIGEWVLEQACIQNKKWQETGYPPIKVSVNLSVLQMKHSDIVTTVKNVLESTGLDPVWLELEITETAIMESKRSVVRILKQLKKIGVSIAIDDFGTGYSSLNYLKRFPVDTLKIDRTFIQDLLTEQDDTVIATAVISMASKLGLKVVAEGVETEEQLNYLHDLHCNEVQGFLISPPIPVKEFEILLEKERLFYKGRKNTG
ncbi:EAL domain-containing protein [Bacillus sp. AK031]